MHNIIQNFLKESRQYQLRASKENGEEDVSQWYDEEEIVFKMKKEIDELEEYTSTVIIKRIKEYDYEEKEDKVADAKIEGKCKTLVQSENKMSIDDVVAKLKKIDKEKGGSATKKAYQDWIKLNKPDKKEIEQVNKKMFEEESDYHKGLSKSTQAKRQAQFNKQAEMDDSDPKAYKPAPGDARAETKPSKYTKEYDKLFGESIAHPLVEKVKAVETKAKETGISYDILKQVYDRGMAAWKTGHRPGAGPHQWALARINSFVTGGKTQKTTDADLWAKVEKSSTKEELSITENRNFGEEQIEMALAQLNHIDEYSRKTIELIKNQPGLEAWVASKITKIDDYMESIYHWLAYKIKNDAE
jgi:hypothetical protein